MDHGIEHFIPFLEFLYEKKYFKTLAINQNRFLSISGTYYSNAPAKQKQSQSSTKGVSSGSYH